jgi:hypothetical protein
LDNQADDFLLYCVSHQGNCRISILSSFLVYIASNCRQPFLDRNHPLYSQLEDLINDDFYIPSNTKIIDDLEGFKMVSYLSSLDGEAVTRRNLVKRERTIWKENLKQELLVLYLWIWVFDVLYLLKWIVNLRSDEC